MKRKSFVKAMFIIPAAFSLRMLAAGSHQGSNL